MNMFENYEDQYTKKDASGNKTDTKKDASGNQTDTKNTRKYLSGNLEATNNDLKTLYYTIFNKSNIILLIWFLAIYLVLYFIVGIFFKGEQSNNASLMLSRSIDVIVLMFMLFFIIL